MNPPEKRGLQRPCLTSVPSRATPAEQCVSCRVSLEAAARRDRPVPEELGELLAPAAPYSSDTTRRRSVASRTRTACQYSSSSRCSSRRMIEPAVARTVGHDRALPDRSDDVHVAGAGLHDESGLRGGVHWRMPARKLRTRAFWRSLRQGCSQPRNANVKARARAGDGDRRSLHARVRARGSRAPRPTRRRGRRPTRAVDATNVEGVEAHRQAPRELCVDRIDQTLFVRGDESAQARA